MGITRSTLVKVIINTSPVVLNPLVSIDKLKPISILLCISRAWHGETDHPVACGQASVAPIDELEASKRQRGGDYVEIMWRPRGAPVSAARPSPCRPSPCTRSTRDCWTRSLGSHRQNRKMVRVVKLVCGLGPANLAATIYAVVPFTPESDATYSLRVTRATPGRFRIPT